MKRLMMTAVLATAMALAGCGRNTATSAYRASTATKAPVAAPQAQGTYAVAPLADTPTGASQLNSAATGALKLQLSALQASGLLGIEVALSGGGLSTPVVQQLTAAQLSRSNTLAFERLPAGNLTLNFTAYGAGEAVVGTAQQAVTIKATGETALSLGMALANGSFSVGAGVAPTTGATTDAVVGDDASVDTTTPVAGLNQLQVEITAKEVVRKLLILKKLAVTVQVTNPGSVPLSGLVTVRFHKVKGIFTKTDAIVETLTEQVTNLPPGRSMELTIQSTVSAEDAEVEVHTTTGSTSANTRDTAFE